jgi:hypothetical protein
MFLFLERFSNSVALASPVQGAFFLRKKPLDSRGFGVWQLENRCTRTLNGLRLIPIRQKF